MSDWRNVFYEEGKHDLRVIEEQAWERTKPRNRWGFEPATTYLHMHPHNKPCGDHEHKMFEKETQG